MLHRPPPILSKNLVVSCCQHTCTEMAVAELIKSQALVMTGCQINRYSFGSMAAQAKVHAQILRSNSNSLLRQITVTLLAIHSSVDMRGVPATDVPVGIGPVSALPGNIFSLVGISCELLDFRVVPRNPLVTCHAEADAGNSSIRSLCASVVA